MFPSGTKLKIRFKSKNIFRKTIAHKSDNVPIHSRPLYTIRRSLNTCYCFYQTSRDHKQHHQFVVSLSLKGFLVYHRLEKLFTAIFSVIDLSNKLVDWKCFGDAWCLMDAFRINYLIRSREGHSNNRWHKFHGSMRKLFGCIDRNLTWLYFSVNDVFVGSAYIIHWDFAMVSLNVEPAQWLIQEHCSC